MPRTQGSLLAAAAHVVSRRAYADAPVGEIVAEAGCSTGALYAHFDGKSDLVLTLLDEGDRWLGHRLPRRVAAADRCRRVREAMTTLIAASALRFVFARRSRLRV